MARMTLEGVACGPAAMEQYRALETGDILYFPTTPFEITDEDRAFLLTQRQVHASYHKNISYRPAQDRLKGVDARDAADRKRMHAVMKRYSQHAISFVAGLLPRYTSGWKIDYASFRPNEEQGRKLSRRARNDLIHVDSFPTRPSYGDRLMRFFTNVNPERPRIWATSDHFAALARVYARPAGLPFAPAGWWSSLRGEAARVLARLGLPVVDRPAYDRFMLGFHHFLKENEAFQQNCPKDLWSFPPGSSWIVFTDASSHACLSGQYALEQTFIISRESLAYPDVSPISILEQMTGFPLAPGRNCA